MKKAWILRSLLSFIVTISDFFLIQLCWAEPTIPIKLLVAISIISRFITLIWTGERLHNDKFTTKPSTWMTIALLLPQWPLLFFEATFFLRDKNEYKDKNNSRKTPARFDKRWRAIHTIIFLIVLGSFMIIFAELEVINWTDTDKWNKKWNDLVITFGSTILLAGVSSIILQVFSSIKIFQKDFVQTFYDMVSADTKYLDTIDFHHLRSNWKVLSKYLYKKKFSELSDELNEIISDEYFPRDHPVYYEDWRNTGRFEMIEGNNGDEMVKLIETITLDIVANNKDDKVYYNFRRSVPRLPSEKDKNIEDGLTSIKLLKFTINGKNYNNDKRLKKCIGKDTGELNSNNNSIVQYYKTKRFSGEKRYNVVIEHEKVYSLKTNQLKTFQAIRVMKNCFVQIQYPEEMIVEFRNRGTVKEFQSINDNLEGFLVEEYSGLILPHQGYIISLRLK